MRAARRGARAVVGSGTLPALPDWMAGAFDPTTPLPPQRLCLVFGGIMLVLLLAALDSTLVSTALQVPPRPPWCGVAP